jgi:transposase
MVLAFDRQINQFVRYDERACRLLQVTGISVLTASAIVANIGTGRDFKNDRQFAAWIRLTPRQYSTGGVQRLGVSCQVS